MIRQAFAALLLCLVSLGALGAAVYPIDRATILAGSKFDFKVEFDGVAAGSNVKITVNGLDYVKALGGKALFIENEDGDKGSAAVVRGASLAKPGRYEVIATDGRQSLRVSWEVFGTGPRRAKNVILFIGDGMTIANRTAARILSRGIREGKYYGALSRRSSAASWTIPRYSALSLRHWVWQGARR